jgi:hypothetical protein
MVAGLRKAIQAGSKAGAQAGFDAGMKVGAKAGAVEGVQAGARYVLKNSRVHRSVERDEEGRIIGSIETREPRESLKSGGNISLMRESLGVPLAALCARGSSARTTRVGLAAQSAECLRRGVDSGLWRLRLASHSLLHGLKA